MIIKENNKEWKDHLCVIALRNSRSKSGTIDAMNRKGKFTLVSINLEEVLPIKYPKLECPIANVFDFSYDLPFKYKKNLINGFSYLHSSIKKLDVI